MSTATIPYAVLDAIVDTFFMTLEEMRKGNPGIDIIKAVMKPYVDELNRRQRVIAYSKA
jgi:hypothetical protein